MPSIADFFAALAEKQKEDRGPGALRWCNRCSRRHRSNQSCNLVAVNRTAKSGRTVTRLVHVEKA